MYTIDYVIYFHSCLNIIINFLLQLSLALKGHKPLSLDTEASIFIRTKKHSFVLYHLHVVNGLHYSHIYVETKWNQ